VCLNDAKWLTLNLDVPPARRRTTTTTASAVSVKSPAAVAPKVLQIKNQQNNKATSFASAAFKVCLSVRSFVHPSPRRVNEEEQLHLIQGRRASERRGCLFFLLSFFIF
jgi:hypothetical protein